MDEKASELGLSVEDRYRVTDKLVQDMIRLARKERPDMFLLGAGSKYRPDTAGSNGVLWLSLFRDKIDDVMEQVKCPVAVFVNRGYSGSSPVSFVLGGVIDAFLLTYLESMLEGEHRFISSFLIRMMKLSGNRPIRSWQNIRLRSGRSLLVVLPI